MLLILQIAMGIVLAVVILNVLFAIPAMMVSAVSAGTGKKKEEPKPTKEYPREIFTVYAFFLSLALLRNSGVTWWLALPAGIAFAAAFYAFTKAFPEATIVIASIVPIFFASFIVSAWGFHYIGGAWWLPIAVSAAITVIACTWLGCRLAVMRKRRIELVADKLDAAQA